jgi:hypothetical protein
MPEPHESLAMPYSARVDDSAPTSYSTHIPNAPPGTRPVVRSDTLTLLKIKIFNP